METNVALRMSCCTRDWMRDGRYGEELVGRGAGWRVNEHMSAALGSSCSSVPSVAVLRPNAW